MVERRIDEWGRIVTAEHVVARMPPGQETEVSPREAGLLIRQGGYLRAIGLLSGVHYRREFGDGCFHLRYHRERWFLHRDEDDPRRFPLEHFVSVPALWVPTLVATALGIGIWMSASRQKDKAR